MIIFNFYVIVMNKIEKLISEYWNVNYYSLSEIWDVYSWLRWKSKDDFKDWNARYITYKNIYNNLSVQLYEDDFVKVADDENQNYIQLWDILVAGSSENIEDSWMISVVTEVPQEKIYLNSFCFWFRLNEEFQDRILPWFSKYLFRSDGFRKDILKCSFGVTRYNLSKEKFLKIKIPVPSKEVQGEIVNILDNYTKLEAELEAELEARKSQYEYYRDKLLAFEKSAERERLERLTIWDIYEFQYWKWNKIPEWTWQYPIYWSNWIVWSIDEYNSEDAPVIWHIWAYAWIVNRAEWKHFVTYNGVICKLKNKNIHPRYWYYLLLKQDYLSKAHSGSQPFVSYDILEAPEVEVPPLNEQEKIVNILDKFGKLTEDITEWLPAEIEMRHKQYEYYRDKLLTFN